MTRTDENTGNRPAGTPDGEATLSTDTDSDLDAKGSAGAERSTETERRTGGEGRAARGSGADGRPAADPGLAPDAPGAPEDAPPASGAPAVSGAPAASPALPAPVLSADGLPGWLGPVVDAARNVRGEQLSSFLPPESGAGRQSAVLILFGQGPDGPELLLTERAGSLRSHAGQPSFPGGSLDPEDGDPATTGPLRAALREAEEETGLDPAGVQLFGVLPRLYIPVSGFVVSPVLGWWHEPSPVRAVDPGETARVFTVPVTELTDPAHRVTAVHPRGFEGPAFQVRSALVWGFTAGVIDRVLHFAGWERPWDRRNRVSLDWHA